MSSLSKRQERQEDAEAAALRKEQSLEFTALNGRFHFTPAHALKQPHKANEPRLIILFGWLGAQLRHVKKYATGYHKLYPTTPIIIVRSYHADLRPFSKFRREFAALTVLLQLHNIDLTQAGNNVLMQVFSNGGCWSLSALMDQLHIYSVIRPRTMIFDSCPGRARYSVFLRAFIHAGNLNWLGKMTITPILTFLYFICKFYCRVRGQDPFGERRREMLHKVRGQRRTYIYSKKDQLISWLDIRHHASMCAEFHKGQEEVRMEEFVGSDHVAHLRLDARRYWNIVQESWDPDCELIDMTPESPSAQQEDPEEAKKEVVAAESVAAKETVGIIEPTNMMQVSTSITSST